MGSSETYTSLVPDWASQFELVVHEPNPAQPEYIDFHFLPQFETQFIVVAASTPNGRCPSFLDAQIEIYDPNGNPLSPVPPIPRRDDQFVYSSSRLIVVNKPIVAGYWKISTHSGIVPYAVTAMAFHPQVPPNSPPSPGPSGASPFKCRACKTTAKALSLAIVAAATLPALPAALLASISTYLGASTAIAVAFVTSVLNDTADVIAEKLCKSVGLC